MPARNKVSPLDWKTPLVDPRTGVPTLQFIRLWEQLFGNEDGTHGVAAEAVPQARQINTTAPLLGGGPLSADLTLTHATSGVTPGAYTSANVTVDANGHVTAAANGGGGGGWSLIATSTTTGVQNVDFTGLAGLSDVLLIGRNVAGSISSFRAVLCSIDNGATWYTASGDYVRPDTSGGTTNQIELDVVNTTSNNALTFTGLLQGINVNGTPKRFTSSSALEALFVGSLAPVNAIRYSHVSGGTITGGTLYLLGR